MPERSTSARITVAASSAAPTSLRAPPKRPTGVRTGEQTTTSRMLRTLFDGSGRSPAAFHPPERGSAQRGEPGAGGGDGVGQAALLAGEAAAGGRLLLGVLRPQDDVAVADGRLPHRDVDV